MQETQKPAAVMQGCDAVREASSQHDHNGLQAGHWLRLERRQ